MYITPWIHNAAHPDTSNVNRLLAHERFRGLQGEALAIALWRYTLPRSWASIISGRLPTAIWSVRTSNSITSRTR